MSFRRHLAHVRPNLCAFGYSSGGVNYYGFSGRFMVAPMSAAGTGMVLMAKSELCAALRPKSDARRSEGKSMALNMPRSVCLGLVLLVLVAACGSDSNSAVTSELESGSVGGSHDSSNGPKGAPPPPPLSDSSQAVPTTTILPGQQMAKEYHFTLVSDGPLGQRPSDASYLPDGAARKIAEVREDLNLALPSLPASTPTVIHSLDYGSLSINPDDGTIVIIWSELEVEAGDYIYLNFRISPVRKTSADRPNNELANCGQIDGVASQKTSVGSYDACYVERRPEHGEQVNILLWKEVQEYWTITNVIPNLGLDQLQSVAEEARVDLDVLVE